jgi:hypothetical protein
MTDEAQAAADRKALNAYYIPTIESCWDYGITRNTPLLPFIASLLPYSFLRGVQYDTKIFKVAELVANARHLFNSFTGKSPSSRNEIIFTVLGGKDEKKLEELNISIPEPRSGPNGEITVEQKQVQAVNEELKKLSTFLTGKEIHIAAEGDSDLTMSITNNYGDGEDIITQVIQGAGELIKNVNEAVRTVQGELGSKGLNMTPYQEARYKGSNFGEVTINFTLFTKNNYVRDIHIPLTFLKKLCLARKSNWPADAEKEIAIDLLKAQNLWQEKTDQLVDERIPAAALEAAKGAIAFADKRFKVVEPPPLLSVEHSARLFFMNKAAIVDFTYKPEGPWVRVEYDGLFGKLFSGGLDINSSVGSALDRLLQDVYVKFPNYPTMCYPTRIKCTLKLRETAFITLEDHAKEDLKRIGTITTSIAKSLADPGSIAGAAIAGGIAQNLDILAPDIKGVGDLLSGGKWVPPGESMSGIPGFL